MRWMYVHFVVGLLIGLVAISSSKPVRGPPQPKPVEAESPDDDDRNTGLAYDSYLREVVDVLESDPEFRAKLENANVSDIKSGKIAQYLELVNHTVRTSLDEIKRREMQRLQDLARIQMAAMTDPNGLDKIKIPSHLDLTNHHSFEMKDLEILIKKTTEDLEELDKQRREDFKEYEMEKEYEKREHLKELPEEERKKEEQRLEDLKKKHAEHPKLNHPGSKDQFEEVWDKVDHLEDQEFDARTFFFKHDLNGDMEWSIDEVNAVLQLELDKVYDPNNAPEEDDPMERIEEMNKMREHVFSEMDKDNNKRISYDEYINYTGAHGENAEFQKDDGWEGLEDQDLFSEDDYLEYVRQHHNQPGMVPPPVDLNFESEHQLQGQQAQHGQFQQPNQHQQQQFQQQQQQFQQQQQQFHQQNQQQQFQQHPNQQQFQQHPNQQQFQQHPNQQQFQQHPNQQQQQFQQGQVNLNQVHQSQGQINNQVHQGDQGQQINNQVPQGQGQINNQVPQGQGQINNQVPQGQINNQVPQGQGQINNQVPQGQGQINNQVNQGQGQINNQVPQGQGQINNQVNQGQINNQVPQGNEIHDKPQGQH